MMSNLNPRQGARWFVAALAAWHMIAITVASVPAPRDLPAPRATAPAADNRLAAMTAPILDTAYAQWRTAARGLWRASAPLRRVTGPYIRITGLEQRWNMFAEPPERDQYIRMRYYTRPASGASAVWVEDELIYPVQTEDRYRPPSVSYYEEKAVRNARQRFFRALRDEPNVTRVEELPRDLHPVVRYYAARQRLRHLETGDQVVRAELWVGSAPVAAPGTSDWPQLQARMAALRAARDEPMSEMRRPEYLPTVGAGERQVDITWTLMYFEEWE
jgi:hypothetical protein